MRLPRKGVVIRLLIYGPLLGYFGWQALEKWRAEQKVQKDPPSVEEQLAPHKQWITLPDGTQQAIYELTPAQAEEILGYELPTAPVAASKGPPSDEGAADN